MGVVALRFVETPSGHSQPAFGFPPESKIVQGLHNVPTGQVALTVVLHLVSVQALGLQLLPTGHLLGSVPAQAEIETEGLDVWGTLLNTARRVKLYISHFWKYTIPGGGTRHEILRRFKFSFAVEFSVARCGKEGCTPFSV